MRRDPQRSIRYYQKNSAPRSRPTDAKAAETRRPALQMVASIFIVSVSKFEAVME